MKGVILAGGTGSRLGKLTTVLNKHLVAVGRVPMIEYPLRTLKRLGVTEIAIVTGKEHAGTIIHYLSEQHPEIDFTYKIQKEAGGIAQALSLVENIYKRDKIAVILGDNIFEEDFHEAAREFEESNHGAMLFLKEVSNPERFGVAEIDAIGKIISLEEKPISPKSNFIATGLYFYDTTIFDKIRLLKCSARGEFEITEANQMYVKEGRVFSKNLKGFWSDAGTHESRQKVQEYLIEKRFSIED